MRRAIEEIEKVVKMLSIKDIEQHSCHSGPTQFLSKFSENFGIHDETKLFYTFDRASLLIVDVSSSFVLSWSHRQDVSN